MGLVQHDDDTFQCGRCDGTGEVPDRWHRPKWCPDCEGRGWRTRDEMVDAGELDPDDEEEDESGE